MSVSIETPEAGSRADRVAGQLREAILRGSLAAGTRLTEVALAESMGVSRTPIREALRSLAAEGFVEPAEGRGYQVLRLASEEVRDLFALIAELEILALTWSGPPTSHRLAAMAEANARFAGARSVDDALRLNAAWHRLLFEASPNAELGRTIEAIRVRIYRYEYHYFASAPVHVATAVELHRAIMEPLGRGDLPLAAAAIRRHWLTDLDKMLPKVV